MLPGERKLTNSVAARGKSEHYMDTWLVKARRYIAYGQHYERDRRAHLQTRVKKIDQRVQLKCRRSKEKKELTTLNIDIRVYIVI